MRNDRRVTELESKLTGGQRALAWLKKHQEEGGYLDLVGRSLQPLGYIERMRGQQEAIERFVIKDQDSAFVFDCAAVCNSEVLQLEFCYEEVALLAMYLRRLLRGVDESVEGIELQSFRSLLRNFAVKGMALADAIEAISRHHLGGHKILFSDTEKGLTERNATARKLFDFFNEIVPAYNAEPITAAELEGAVSVEAVNTEEHLVTLTRLQVDRRFTGGVNMGQWVAPYVDDVRNLRASKEAAQR